MPSGAPIDPADDDVRPDGGRRDEGPDRECPEGREGPEDPPEHDDHRPTPRPFGDLATFLGN